MNRKALLIFVVFTAIIAAIFISNAVAYMQYLSHTKVEDPKGYWDYRPGLIFLVPALIIGDALIFTLSANGKKKTSTGATVAALSAVMLLCPLVTISPIAQSTSAPISVTTTDLTKYHITLNLLLYFSGEMKGQADFLTPLNQEVHDWIFYPPQDPWGNFAVTTNDYFWFTARIKFVCINDPVGEFLNFTNPSETYQDESGTTYYDTAAVMQTALSMVSNYTDSNGAYMWQPRTVNGTWIDGVIFITTVNLDSEGLGYPGWHAVLVQYAAIPNMIAKLNHELGHFCGLLHCGDTDCVMNPNAVLCLSTESFCSNCSAKLVAYKMHRIGDVLNHGQVDIYDLVCIARYIGGTYNATADVNMDGTVDIFDLVAAAHNIT